MSTGHLFCQFLHRYASPVCRIHQDLWRMSVQRIYYLYLLQDREYYHHPDFIRFKFRHLNALLPCHYLSVRANLAFKSLVISTPIKKRSCRIKAAKSRLNPSYPIIEAAIRRDGPNVCIKIKSVLLEKNISNCRDRYFSIVHPQSYVYTNITSRREHMKKTHGYYLPYIF